jgi:Cu/Ag efflux pump CusA
MRISRLHLHAGTYVEFSGTAEAQTRSRRDLLVDSLLAGLGILLLLSVVIGNYRNLLLVLTNLRSRWSEGCSRRGLPEAIFRSGPSSAL